jgi:Peptidase family S41
VVMLKKSIKDKNMRKLQYSLLALCLMSGLSINAQSLSNKKTAVVDRSLTNQRLSIKQQTEDFEIFNGGLKEGHAGVYYFITKAAFEKKCDSIKKSFQEAATVEDFYLKLRFLVTLLRHGHTRINLPKHDPVNYKMAVLNPQKLYLPFQFQIIKNQLVVIEDCTKEQIIPKYSVVKSINNISSARLIQKMLPYMPADGINETFKYYSLYNYFYLHYLFNLFYPDKKGVKIELEKNNTHFYIQLLHPGTIDSIYFAKNKKSISQYGQQLAYKSGSPGKTAYLMVSSFYKGLIENFGQKYIPFLDSSFADIKSKRTTKLIIDIRNNEGGGDNYDGILLSYIVDKLPAVNKVISVPAKDFPFNRYAINLPADVKAYIENPTEFLQDDSSLLLKQQYVDMMAGERPAISGNNFNGSIIVLTNGGSFSASSSFIRELYNYRKTSKRQIVFIGEENGGDIYCNTGCSGQGYIVKLPNSNIEVDMPFLCFGALNTDYPKKRLPDLEIYPNIKNLANGVDDVLESAVKLLNK